MKNFRKQYLLEIMLQLHWHPNKLIIENTLKNSVDTVNHNQSWKSSKHKLWWEGDCHGVHGAMKDMTLK